jgi:hypothetical protein
VSSIMISKLVNYLSMSFCSAINNSYYWSLHFIGNFVTRFIVNSFQVFSWSCSIHLTSVKAKANAIREDACFVNAISSIL